MSNSNSFGKALYSALRDRKPIGPLSEQDSTLTVDDAYAISLEFLSLRQKDGERVIGKKIGVVDPEELAHIIYGLNEIIGA